jgi:hypothetical protein
MPKFIEIWTPGNTAYAGQFHPAFISLVNVPRWLENKWCQINRWLGLHVNSFLPCMSSIVKPWHRVLRVTPWIQDSRCATVRWREACLLGEFLTQVAQRPVDNSNHGAWYVGLAVCLEFPNPDDLRSTMFSCCPCHCFPQATFKWDSFHTNQGHLPPAYSVDWLGCHSNTPGRSCLWTLPVPFDVSPLWHHNQLFSVWLMHKHSH